jgi:hypothetical protein
MPNPQESIECLVAQFLNRTLPKKDWTHEAHLRVGLWHVLQFGPDSALELLRRRIQRFNVASGTPNTDNGGYHETITRFYVWLIDRFVGSADRTRPIDQLADDLVQRHGDKELPLRYYSKARLMSLAARQGWIEPDLLPLDPNQRTNKLPVS